MLRGPNCGGGELKIIVAMLERAVRLAISDRVPAQTQARLQSLAAALEHGGSA
ncbi:MAG: hypothetical protein KBF63_21050 [Rhodoferax sp.]|jgi:hypothetical protein|nr:hypothetical protein [Rhodoferax sp.]MBP9931771.1 hypothetical protein [Rhodoferax sp.]